MSEPDDRAPDARFTLANERTLLAYQRSAIGLMAAAIAVAHFFGDDLEVLLLALALLGTGVFAAVGGYLRYRQVDAALRKGRPIRAVPRPTWSASLCCCAWSSRPSTSSRRPAELCQRPRR